MSHELATYRINSIAVTAKGLHLSHDKAIDKLIAKVQLPATVFFVRYGGDYKKLAKRVINSGERMMRVQEIENGSYAARWSDHAGWRMSGFSESGHSRNAQACLELSLDLPIIKVFSITIMDSSYSSHETETNQEAVLFL